MWIRGDKAEKREERGEEVVRGWIGILKKGRIEARKGCVTEENRRRAERGRTN